MMIILFLISLLLSVILHEMAHFIVAKLCKCKIEIVSIGFGKSILKKKIKGIIYQLCPILLGGYVKLKDETKYGRDKHIFTNLKYRYKLAISLAGCLANIKIGLGSYFLGIYFNNYYLVYFGFMNLILGITNLIPIPCLDGSYPILVWLEKKYGKKKGYKIMDKINKIGFKILMILNILTIYFWGLFQYIKYLKRL